MSLDDRSENKGKAYLIDQVSLKRLLFLAVIISVLPVVLIFVGKFTHILEWYFIILMYTITMFFFTYLFFQNFQKKLLQEMKALVKKEGIIIFGLDTLVNDDGKRIVSEINTLSVGGFPQAQEQTGKPVLKDTINLIFDYIEELKCLKQK